MIPWSPVNQGLIDLPVGADSGVGANYARRTAVFPVQVSNIASAPVQRCPYDQGSPMISTVEPSLKAEARELWKEAPAPHLIFSRIWRSTRT